MRRTILLALLLVGYAAILLSRSGLRERVQFDPFTPRARTVEQRIGEGRFVDALPIALELEREYPGEPLIRYWVARAYRGLNQPQQEIDAWESYVRVSPAPAEACPSLPETLDRLGRVADALSAFERCAGFDPEDLDRLVDLGDAYQRAGRAADARQQFERAIALDAGHPWVRQRLARLQGSAR